MADKKVAKKPRVKKPAVKKQSKQERIEIVFEGRKETLDIINTGGEIVSYLSTLSSMCPLIGSEIEVVKELGRGSFGTAYLVKIPGMGYKQYVAKRISALSEPEFFDLDGPVALEYIADFIEKDSMISAGALIAVNGGDPKKMIVPENGKVKIYIPTYATMCKTEGPTLVSKSSGDGQDVNIPTGSYLCENNQYSEYINGLLCAELYRNGTSVNFIDIFSFITCPEDTMDGNDIQDRGAQYVFMERIDSDLINYLGNLSKAQLKTQVENIYIQTLHAILCYQRTYQLQHNDLHDGNIFIERIKKESKYKGEILYDADWFHYSVDGTDLYMRAIPALVKIGDFGLSVKYSHPIVGDNSVIDNGYDQFDGKGARIPNWYTENYDVLTAASFIHSEHKNSSKLIDSIIVDAATQAGGGLYDAFDSETLRPIVSKLDSMKNFSPEKILLNKKLMKKYTTKPRSGKIVTLGVI